VVGQVVEAAHHENLAGEFGHGDERGFHAGELGEIGRTGWDRPGWLPPARPPAERGLTRAHGAASRVPAACGR
jgi:hypothetical protein